MLPRRLDLAPEVTLLRGETPKVKGGTPMRKKDKRYFKLVSEEGVPAPIGPYKGYEIEGLVFVSVLGATDSALRKLAKELGDQYYKRSLAGEPLPALIVCNKELHAYRWVPVNEEE